MNRLRTLSTAARAKIEHLTRRDMLMGVGGMVAGSVVGQAFLDPITEPVADHVREAVYGRDTIDPSSTEATAARLPGMRDNAIAEARDIAAETGGLNPLWWERAERAGVLKYATRVKRRDDGRLIIVSQGHGITLWGEDAPERMRGVPLDEQPDQKFGRFADRCMWEAMEHRKPALHARRAETIIKGHDRPRMLEYFAWTASDGHEAVSVALTLAQVAQARSPERQPQDTEGEHRPLLSSDSTTPSRPAARLVSRLPRSVSL